MIKMFIVINYETSAEVYLNLFFLEIIFDNIKGVHSEEFFFKLLKS